MWRCIVVYFAGSYHIGGKLSTHNEFAILHRLSHRFDKKELVKLVWVSFFRQASCHFQVAAEHADDFSLCFYCLQGSLGAISVTGQEARKDLGIKRATRNSGGGFQSGAEFIWHAKGIRLLCVSISHVAIVDGISILFNEST